MAIACDAQFEIERFAPQDSPRTVTISASLPATRVSVVTSGDDKDKTTWTEGDKIAIWNTSGAKFDFEIETGEDSEYATFKCTTFTGELGSKAVYPAAWAGETLGTITIPEYINWEDNIFPAVMASKVEVIDNYEVAPLYFHSLMPIMEFTLQNVPAYACALKLWSKTGASLHDTWTVNEDCTAFTGETPTGNTQQVIYFPYKTAYGSEGSITIRAAIPAYEYTDLYIRVLDGDEAVIEGTGKKVPTTVIDKMKNNLKAYVVMAALNVRTMVGNSRDKYVKVEGVKWAKGNLRAWKDGTTGTGWQTGWNVYDNQWESHYMLLNDNITGGNANFDMNSSKYKEDNVYSRWDYFSWGTLARASRVYNQVLYSSQALFDITKKVYSSESNLGITLEAATDISGLTPLEGEARWVEYNSFSSTNLSYAGDLAFWASKGQYRMPTSNELQMLYSKAGTVNGRANMQAGSYTVDGKTVNGLLFTTTPSWATTPTYNTTRVAFTDADIESGLFLPSIGIRGTIPETFSNMKVNGFNGWGAYWSGTFGKKEVSGFEKTVYAIGWPTGNSLMFGYTSQISNNNGALSYGDPRCGCAIRPVLVED